MSDVLSNKERLAGKLQASALHRSKQSAKPKGIEPINYQAMSSDDKTEYALVLGMLVMQALDDAQRSGSYLIVGKTRDGNAYLLTNTDGFGMKTFAGGTTLAEVCKEVDEKLLGSRVVSGVLGVQPVSAEETPF